MTGDTLIPDLDIAPQSAYVIRADPRPSPLPEPQAEHSEPPQPIQLLVAYGPDGKAVGTITRDRLLCCTGPMSKPAPTEKTHHLMLFPMLSPA